MRVINYYVDRYKSDDEDKSRFPPAAAIAAVA
jgi:hypothetical protein